MSKKTIIISAIFSALMLWPSININATSEIPLSATYIDPNHDQGEPQRGPANVPEVSIDGYTLLFGANCEGCTLRVIDEDGELVYSAFVSSTTTSIILPAWLEGDYELQLYPTGLNYYYYGWIEL